MYRCPQGHETEKWVVLIKDTPKDVECQWCGMTAERIISAGHFRMAGETKKPDTPKQAWEGTPLEDGSDMIDRYKFRKYGPKTRIGMGEADV